MKHWVNTYPHDIYASVLLLDGKIEAWRVDKTKIDAIVHLDPEHWKEGRDNDYEIKSKKWTVENAEGHNYVFNTLAPAWFANWKLADDYQLASPWDKI